MTAFHRLSLNFCCPSPQDLEIRDRRGMTAAHHAAKAGHAESLGLLASVRADATATATATCPAAPHKAAPIYHPCCSVAR